MKQFIDPHSKQRGPKSHPWITTRFLRRDTDTPGTSIITLALRQLREAFHDVSVAKKLGGLQWRLRFWLSVYHITLSIHPIAIKRIIQFKLRLPEGSMQVGLRLNHSDIYVFRELFLREIYRFPYKNHLGTVRTVVDLGANTGLSAAYFQCLFPDAEIIVVEPIQENLQLIRSNAELSGNHWIIEPAAIASTSGVRVFYPNQWWSSSSMHPSVVAQREGLESRVEHNWQLPTREVPSVSMEDLMHKHGISEIDLLKIDIEGGEEELLGSGDAPWLSNVRIIVMEIHRKYIDERSIMDSLEDAGFVHHDLPNSPCDVFINRKYMT